MNEQFIQDAISHGARIERLLHLLHTNYASWRFDKKTDYVNQEFNYSSGAEDQRRGERIDVIATFNGRRRLAIIETKVVAADSDIEQLVWYLRNCEQLRNADAESFGEVDFSETVGILLAREFLPGAYDPPQNCHLVQFDFGEGEFPFKVSPPVVRSTSDATLKYSRLQRVDGHRSYVSDTTLRDAFDDLTNAFLDNDDPRRQWLVKNPKGGHVAVHYKGEYIVWIFVGRTHIDFGYRKPNGDHENVRLTVEDDDRQRKLVECRTNVANVMASIDAEFRDFIPASFSWNDPPDTPEE